MGRTSVLLVYIVMIRRNDVMSKKVRIRHVRILMNARIIFFVGIKRHVYGICLWK